MRPGWAGARLVAATLIAAAGCAGAGAPAERDDAIEVFGPYRGVEADRFADVLAAFERASGIDVRYVGTADLAGELERRSGEGNDPPDLAVVPQVGLVRQLVGDGRILPLGTSARQAVEDDYSPGSVALGTVDGTPYGVPFRLTFKSLVWYRPDVFEEHGWTPPDTLDELEALLDRIETGTGLAPWCFGLEAGWATGWPATDWVEDLVLRSVGPDRYQRWATGDIGFDDPEIADAFGRFRALVLDAGRSAGNLTGVIATPVDETVAGLFADPPECVLYKQADFAVGWMPEGTSIGPGGDVDFFVLPGEVAGPAPVVIGGDQIVRFSEDPEVEALMAYLASPRAGAIWAGQGGFLSPNTALSDDDYPQQYLEALAGALVAAPALAFDASDQMPPSVGTELLWGAITEWVAGADDYETFAATIDGAMAEATADRGEGS